MGSVSCLLFASAAFAQSDLGSITGTITDPNGDVVEGATVQVANTATGAIYTAATLSTGVYTSSVSPGLYEISVPIIGLIGFKCSRYSHEIPIAIQAGQTFHLDIQLAWQDMGSPGDDLYLAVHNKYAGQVVGPAPRTMDGKPDYSGVWVAARDLNPIEAEAVALPWAAEVLQERRKTVRDLPSAYCLPGSPVPIAPWLYKIIQTPSLLVQLMENDAHYRQVFLDGRPHPADLNPTWTGHSVGQWDGQTVVIDTVGFNGKTWPPGFLPHTHQLHVIERYRRPDLGHLEINVTCHDPGALTGPLRTRQIWELVPGEEVQEYVSENSRYSELAR